MSWLFGVNKGNNPDFSQFVQPSGGDDDDGDKNKNKGNQGHSSSDAYRFDSSALERAAKAAKELESSSHAKDILEVTKKQEEAKYAENMRMSKERELEIERFRIEEIKIAGEERRKSLVEETKQRQRQAEYQDQLARKRQDDQLAQQARMQEENLRKQEESVAKQEAMRLKALEKEFKLREEIEVKKITAQVKAQSMSDRENREINLEKIRTEGDEKRKTILGSIQTSGDVLGAGFDAFLSNKGKLTAVVVGLSALAGGIYAAKYGFGTAARFIEKRLIKPSLVKETSRLTFKEACKHPIKTFKRLTSKAEDAMKGIILEPSLEAKLRDIAIATRNTKKNGGYYRNILFFGPPGTGKTMFAKSLAHHSGMDYAIMTGGDVSPMLSDGVNAMHQMFDWAQTSRKGLLLFVDEADAFLLKRSQVKISEDFRSTLNTFLFRTGEQSNKFMLVLASNLPQQFDRAINDRIDEMVRFDVPSLEERERMVRLYFDKFVLQPAVEGKKRIKVDQFDYGKKCSEIARRSEGFSGREISKLGVAWQVATYVSDNGVLTEEMIDRIVDEAVKTHKLKNMWQKDEDIEDDEQQTLKDSASFIPK